jgi:hypothetical protein
MCDHSAKGPLLIELAMVFEEPVDRFGNSSNCRYSSDISIRGIPAPAVELSNQCGEPAVGQLAVRCPQGLPHSLAVMEPIDVKGTGAFVQRKLATAKPKELAVPEVAAEGV